MEICPYHPAERGAWLLAQLYPDPFDFLDAVYDLMLEAGPVDIRVKQSHIELFQFEG